MLPFTFYETWNFIIYVFVLGLILAPCLWISLQQSFCCRLLTIRWGHDHLIALLDTIKYPMYCIFLCGHFGYSLLIFAIRKPREGLCWDFCFSRGSREWFLWRINPQNTSLLPHCSWSGTALHWKPLNSHICFGFQYLQRIVKTIWSYS